MSCFSLPSLPSSDYKNHEIVRLVLKPYYKYFHRHGSWCGGRSSIEGYNV